MCMGSEPAWSIIVSSGFLVVNILLTVYSYSTGVISVAIFIMMTSTPNERRSGYPPLYRRPSVIRKSSTPLKEILLRCSLAANVVLVGILYWWAKIGTVGTSVGGLLEKRMTFNGGHPLSKIPGSCWCSGVDGYCLCTPSLAIDLVILSGDSHVWLVRRKDTDQLATMGGFVEIGESAETTVARELKEEMGIILTKPPKLFGIYSDPRRDNRRHTVSAAYVVHLDGDEKPVAADDVKEVIRLPISEIEDHQYFADHRTILLDYRRILKNGAGAKATDFISSEGDFANDIIRTVAI